MARVATARVSEWLDPEDEPPPKGTKLMLLTKYGIAVFGHWMDGMDLVAWSPMPKVTSQKIRDRMDLSWGTGTTKTSRS